MTLVVDSCGKGHVSKTLDSEPLYSFESLKGLKKQLRREIELEKKAKHAAQVRFCDFRSRFVDPIDSKRVVNLNYTKDITEILLDIELYGEREFGRSLELHFFSDESGYLSFLGHEERIISFRDINDLYNQINK